MYMKGKMGFVVCICALILFSMSATAVFEVPAGAVTFGSIEYVLARRGIL